MPGSGSFPLRIAAFAGLFLVAGTSGALAQDRVGVSSAVNPDATGKPPGGNVRKLVIGQEVVFNERIATGPNGQTQLLFLDESSMSIGPNSDLTIDQFVYDPKSGNGKLAMSATRGLLRYVGGKLSKQEDAVTLRTSTATLAVRGGAFIANIGPNGTDAVFIYGKGLKIAGLDAGGLQIVTRPGYHSVTPPGGSPTPPGPTPPGQMANFTAQLDGRSGGTGGAEIIPTDTSVANSGISQTVSGDVGGSVTAAAGTTSGATTPITNPTNPNNIDTSSLTQTVQGSTQSAAGCTDTSSCAQGSFPPPNPPPPPPVAGGYSGFYKTTPGSGSSRGFVSNSSAFNIPYTGGQIGADGFYTAQLNGQTIRFPVAANSGFRAFTAQDGTQSPFGPINGTSFVNSDQTFIYSNNTETNFTDEHSFVYGGTPVNPTAYQTTGPGLRPQAGSNTRVFAYQVQSDAALQSNIPFVRRQAGGNLPNAAVSPLYVVAPPTTPIGDTSTAAGARALQASLAVNGQGANQQSTIAVATGTIGTQQNGQPILNGQLRGSSLQSAGGTPVRIGSAVNSMVDGAGNSFYGGTAISGFAVDQGAPATASEVPLSGAATTYGFAQPALATAVPAGVGANRTTQAMSGNFGGLMYNNRQATPYAVTGGAFVATDAPNNRVQATLSSTPNPAVPLGDTIMGVAGAAAPGVTSVTMQYGGLTGAAGAQAFVDNNTFAAAESQVNPSQITVNGNTSSNGQLYFTSSGAAGAPTSVLPAGTAYCQCQYLQWGYWGGDLNSNDASGARIDRGHINTWVAGVPTSPADLNTLAASSNPTGTYTGHAIGSVFNNGASYVAAGALNATYNFASQSGTFAVTNFDGRSFGGAGRAPLTGANYTFGVTALPGSPPLVGKATGTFYGPMAAETGGSFAVGSPSGPAYIASGTFAGKR